MSRKVSNKTWLVAKTHVVSWAAILAVTASMSVEAQTQDSFILEEIIVTAQKREETLQEVPVAVSVLSSNALRENFVDSIDTLTTLAPSLTFTTSNSDLNASVLIRGVGTFTFSQTVEPSVSFVVDGVSLARQGQGFQDLIDIERVEVLRGPQSTLFGKNASAGVINVVTKKPSDEFEFDAEFQFAELNEVNVKASVSGPLSEKVKGRLSSFYKRRDGHIENLFDDRDLNGYENWGLRGKLQIDPTENLELLLVGEYRENRADCCIWSARGFGNDINDVSYALSDGGLAYLASNGGIIPSETNSQTYAGGELFNNSDQWGFSLEANWDIGEYILTSISAVKGWEFHNNIDVDTTANLLPLANAPQVSIGIPQTTALPVLDINGHETMVEQYSQEIRLQSPAGEKFDYVVGLYGFYFDLEDRFDRRYGFIFPFEVQPFVYYAAPVFASGSSYTTVNTRNIAAFGQANYHINDKLDFIFGGRILHERLEYTVFSDLNSAFEAGDNELYSNELDTRDTPPVVSDTAATIKAGIAYELSETVNTYATYTSGYKGRASQTRVVTDQLSNTTVSVNTVDPETSDAYEIGLKYLSEDKRFQMNLALFLTDYQGLQLQIFDPAANAVILSNAGQVTTKGIELDFVARPSIYGLTLSGGFAYIDAKIDELVGQVCFPGQKVSEGCDYSTSETGVQTLTDADLPNSPNLKLNVAARYERELSASGVSGFAQISYNWQDDVQYVLGGSDETIQESFGIANASVGLTSPEGTYTFTVYAKNLFDTQYATSHYDDFLVPGLVNHFIPREAERYFGASLRVSF